MRTASQLKTRMTIRHYGDTLLIAFGVALGVLWLALFRHYVTP